MRLYVLFSLFGEFLESGHDSAVLHRTIELSPRLAHEIPGDALAVEHTDARPLGQHRLDQLS
jgi:hypothetical protein